MNPDEQALRAGVKADPLDYHPHGVLADWLDEQGRCDEATWERSWTPKRDAEKWLRDFADKVDCNYEDMISVAESHCKGEGRWGDYLIEGGKWEGQDTPDEFWKNYTILTGKEPDTKHGLPGIFSCSC